jgi:hypothetical protein
VDKDEFVIYFSILVFSDFVSMFIALSDKKEEHGVWKHSNDKIA